MFFLELVTSEKYKKPIKGDKLKDRIKRDFITSNKLISMGYFCYELQQYNILSYFYKLKEEFPTVFNYDKKFLDKLDIKIALRVLPDFEKNNRVNFNKFNCKKEVKKLIKIVNMLYELYKTDKKLFNLLVNLYEMID
jgi:hypothetical protein